MKFSAASFLCLASFVLPGLLRAEPLPTPPGLVTTASGFKYAITRHGTGAQPAAGQVVLAHYTGYLPDGTAFDSSRDAAEPFAFTLDRKQVIKGWDEGFALLHVGDQATFIIPPDLAYGAKAVGSIPPNSTLRFDVEFVALKNGALADRLQETIDSKGLAAAQECFAEFRAGKLGELFVSESQMNALGYRYLGKEGKLPVALAVLQWNVELFPASGNVYDSYGEALLKDGQTEAARQNYAKSLELDPKNKNAVKVLAELKAAAESPAGQAQMQARTQLEAAMDAAFEAADKQVYDLPALHAKLAGFLEKYPQDPDAASLVGNFFYYAEMVDLKAAQAEWAAFAASPNAKVREITAQKLQLAELIKSPLDLKFTAADGREVDVATLRGKVVLVDFWATWCGPCVAEIPNVVAVYGQYHPQGFEIVGISFDQAPDAAKPAKRQKTADQVLAFTAAHHMPWPQYYDGTYWANPYGRKYGIRGIPAMFLLDKHGMVVSTNARGPKLEKEVKRLLAE
jgi:FKBP-type peptidyl-prolyl cis-trans isomerase 2